MAHSLIAIVIGGGVAAASALVLVPSENPPPLGASVQVASLAGVPLEAWAAEGLTAAQVASTLAVDEDRLVEINRVRSAMSDVVEKGRSLGESLASARSAPGQASHREAVMTLRQQVGAAKAEFTDAQTALLTSIVADAPACQTERLRASGRCAQSGLPVWVSRSGAEDVHLMRYASAKRAQARAARMGRQLPAQLKTLIDSVEQNSAVQQTRAWVEEQRTGLMPLALEQEPLPRQRP